MVIEQTGTQQMIQQMLWETAIPVSHAHYSNQFRIVDIIQTLSSSKLNS